MATVKRDAPFKLIAKSAVLGIVLACTTAPHGGVVAQTGAQSIGDLILQATTGESVQLPSAIPMPRRKPAGSVRPMQASIQTTRPAVEQQWAPRVIQAGAIPRAEQSAVKNAIALIDKGQFSDAWQIAAGLKHPAAKGVVQYIILRQSNSGRSVDDYAHFLFANADWPTERIRARMENAMIEQGVSAPSALHILSAFPPESGDGHLALALAQQATGNGKAAAQTIRSSWVSGEIFGKDGEEQAMRVLGRYLTKNDHEVRMRALFYNDDNISGLRAAARLDAGQRKLGEAWAAVNKRAKNARSLLNAVPNSLHNDPAYQFIEIQWHRRAGKELQAAKLMAKAQRDPRLLIDRDEWWIERRLQARDALEAGRPRLAYQIAAGHSAETEWLAIEAEFHAGWIALRWLKDTGTAAKHFNNAIQLARTPISRSRAHYWMGRALQAAGQPTATGHYQAAAAFPTTYYGQLAINALGGTAIRIPSRPPENKRLTNSAPMMAVNLLHDLGETEYLGTFFYDLRERLTDPGDIAYLADRAGDLGLTHLQVRIGKKATQDGLPFERHAFPVGAVPNVKGSNLPEQALIYAIARQESEFNARARSPAGARGLMQVMPATAKGIAKRNGYRYSIDKLSGDPKYNATFGATYLGERIGQFNGSYILAIASYNAGKGNVDKWIKRFGDPRDPRIDPVDWVELIPFTETRNYVQRVMENLQVYRALLPGTPAQIALARDLMRGATN
ncbi:MAG: lytic transglycosylase domain-containing protein [Rhodobiaceae bacterium]|nr:lytic transglycosylase domain-containing protein [Rhodobiaceae bacterium]